MYLLVQKDCFCEMNIADDIISLFDFSKPYEEEELEIIDYLKDLIDNHQQVPQKRFIKKFNENNKYEIIDIAS